jgi:hypothetical protein
MNFDRRMTMRKLLFLFFLFLPLTVIIAQDTSNFTFADEVTVIYPPRSDQGMDNHLSPMGNFIVGRLWLTGHPPLPSNYWDKDGAVRFWHRSDVSRIIDIPVENVVGSNFAFSDDETFLAFVTRTGVTIWNTHKLKEFMTIPFDHSIFLRTTPSTAFISWASNTNTLLVIDGNEVLFVDVTTREIKRQSLNIKFEQLTYIERSQKEWVLYPNTAGDVRRRGSHFVICGQIDLSCTAYRLSYTPSNMTISEDGEVMLLEYYDEGERRYKTDQWLKVGNKYLLQGDLTVLSTEAIVSFSHDKTYLLTQDGWQKTVWDYEALTPVWTVEASEARWIPFTHSLITLNYDYNLHEISLAIYELGQPSPVDKINLVNHLDKNRWEVLESKPDWILISSISRDGEYVLIELGWASCIVQIERNP